MANIDDRIYTLNIKFPIQERSMQGWKLIVLPNSKKWFLWTRIKLFEFIEE